MSVFFFILCQAIVIQPIPNHIKREDHDKYLWLELGWILDRSIKNRQYPEDKNCIKSWLNQRKQLKREIATM